MSELVIGDTTEQNIEDMRKAVSISNVLKMINYHLQGNKTGFKQVSMIIAKELNDKGFEELAQYIWAQYEEVSTFKITD